MNPPNLRHLTPSQIVEAVKVRMPRQFQRWLVRGCKADVIGVLPWAGDRAVWIRLRTPGRRVAYFACWRYGSKLRVDLAPSPDQGRRWARMDRMQTLVPERRREALARLRTAYHRKHQGKQP